MFSLKIVDTDEFLDMPPTTQNLYFHLCMRADDDGFVSNPKKIMKIINSATDDIKVLIGKKFVIPFESGVCVIKHWKIHNLIRKDRYTETEYKKEKKLLIEQDNKYKLNSGKQEVIPNGNQEATTGMHRLGKVRLDKVSKDTSKEVVKPTSYGNKDINEIYDFLKERLSGTPDGTIKQNRQFAKLLLNKFKKDYPDKKSTELVCFLIKLALKDDFHSKNATSFKYLYYNAQKIISSAKQNKNNPKYIKL